MVQHTVLLVEDNRLLRNWISNTLQSAGFEVVSPETVEEALDLAATQPFDVLVTDWRLTDGCDGFAVLARARTSFPQVPSVLISADADARLAEHARNAGFNAVLEKPFPPWKIIATLHSLLAARPIEVQS